MRIRNEYYTLKNIKSIKMSDITSEKHVCSKVPKIFYYRRIVITYLDNSADNICFADYEKCDELMKESLEIFNKMIDIVEGM